MSTPAQPQTREELQAMINALEAQNKALKAQKEVIAAEERKLFRMRIGAKGGLSVYGLGRFPVTLRKGQWEKLFTHTAEIQKFLTDNALALK